MLLTLFTSNENIEANRVEQDQAASIGAVYSLSTRFAKEASKSFNYYVFYSYPQRRKYICNQNQTTNTRTNDVGTPNAIQLVKVTGDWRPSFSYTLQTREVCIDEKTE